MSWPKISLVIPSFNAVCTIERTLASVVSQNYPNLEVILVDGGSKDGTMEVVRKYSAHLAHCLSEPDRGQAHALNKGFKLATGEMFGWLCADDELTPGALAHAAQLFRDNPAVNLLTGGCMRVFSNGKTVETKPVASWWDHISFQNGIEQPSTFWKADLHRAVGQLDESYNYAFDWAWWNELKRAGAVPLATEVILSRYYFSESNKTATGGRKLVEEMYRVVKKYGPLKGRLADIYLFLYVNYDLRGYFDRPPIPGKLKMKLFSMGLKLLSKIVGKKFIRAYNWTFASRQERNLCWHA